MEKDKEIDYLLVDSLRCGYHGNVSIKMREKRQHIKDLALRAKRGEHVGRDAIRKAIHSLKEVTSIYFIMCGNGRAIKIGRSDDVSVRLIELQVANHEKLKLIAAFSATHDMEDAVHSALSEHRIRGEWFSCHDDVLMMAEAALDGGLDLVIETIKKIKGQHT